jgi:hypothetical protein
VGYERLVTRLVKCKLFMCGKYKFTGKRPLGRPRLRWEYNTRMDLKVICINTRNWVDLAQDRDYFRALVNAALNPRIP